MTDQLRRFALGDAVSELPAIQHLESATPDRIDIYVAALGFEPRTSAVIEFIADARSRIGTGIVLEYPSNIGANERMRPSLEGNLRRCGAGISWSSNGLVQYIQAIRNAVDSFIKANGRLPRLAIDVSSMTGRVVMSIISAALGMNAELQILYAEAEIYFPTQEDFDNNKDVWRSPDALGLERGVGEVSIAVDFPGSAESDRPDWIVAFAGFGRDRMRRAISYVNPALLIESRGSIGWAVGKPPLESNAWRSDAVKYIHEVPDNADVYLVSTFDYRDTLSVLETACASRELTHNITLIPLGSKLQGLGMGLYCSLRRNIRVVSATPSLYRADQYSAGVAALWSIDFGESRELAKLLDRVDTLEWVGGSRDDADD